MTYLNAKVGQSFFVELGIDGNRTLSQEVYDQLVHGKNSSSEVKCRSFSVYLLLQASRIVEDFLQR